MLAACQEQKEIREGLTGKPAAIKDYEARLRHVLFLYHRAGAHSSKGQRKTAKAMFNRADAAFERTLEFLQEITETDPSLCIWFDRDTDWAAGGKLDISPTRMPSVIASRSLARVGGKGMMAVKRNKREVKLDSVRSVLDELTLASDQAEIPV